MQTFVNFLNLKVVLSLTMVTFPSYMLETNTTVSLYGWNILLEIFIE